MRAGVVPRSPQGQRPHPDLPALAQLPLSLYKKVLLITHDAILPQLAQPTLMIDFLTRACDLGECGCLVHTTPQPPSVSVAASLTPVAAPPIPPTPQPLPRSTSSPPLQPPPPTPCPACGFQLCVRGGCGRGQQGQGHTPQLTLSVGREWEWERGHCSSSVSICLQVGPSASWP